MDTLIAFAEFLLGFVPFLLIVAVALFLFWIATKCIPSLNEWLHDTTGMVETDSDRYYESRRPKTTYDNYV
jgi:hypothetical protein